jgi:hypothetical protein
MLLLSNVMPDQPPGSNTMSATIRDVRSSGQDGMQVNSKIDQAGSLPNQSASSNNVPCASTFPHEIIRDTGEVSKLYILARTRPPFTQNGQDFSFRPLQHEIWCLVFDASTEKMKFMLLCACQDLARSGVDIEDIDWGKGIHPVADKAWMDNLIRAGEWSRKVYDLIDVVSRPVGKISYSTIVLHVKDTKHRKLLWELRGVLGYNSDTLVRVPRSNFNCDEEKQLISKLIKRGKKKRLISKLIPANSEDPAPCKHRILPVIRHSKRAQSVSCNKRKPSKPNSKR